MLFAFDLCYVHVFAYMRMIILLLIWTCFGFDFLMIKKPTVQRYAIDIRIALSFYQRLIQRKLDTITCAYKGGVLPHI